MGRSSRPSSARPRMLNQQPEISFEEAFQQIKAATGIDNIDELVQTFIDAEDQNFSLFNYVNELNNEVHGLDLKNI